MLYRLEGTVPVPVSEDDWKGNDQDRRVAQSIRGGIRISTVFLMIDHGFGSDDRPILFETMVFGGEHDEYTRRYATWEEAEEGHRETCLLVFGEVPGRPTRYDRDPV